MDKVFEHKGKIYTCSISYAMELVGGKWKSVILYHLKNSTKRFNELKKGIDGITEMTLNLQLKKLEEDGLISRYVEGDKPPIKVYYSLTDFGNTFIPVLEALHKWGDQTIKLQKNIF